MVHDAIRHRCPQNTSTCHIAYGCPSKGHEVDVCTPSVKGRDRRCPRARFDAGQFAVECSGKGFSMANCCGRIRNPSNRDWAAARSFCAQFCIECLREYSCMDSLSWSRSQMARSCGSRQLQRSPDCLEQVLAMGSPEQGELAASPSGSFANLLGRPASLQQRGCGSM